MATTTRRPRTSPKSTRWTDIATRTTHRRLENAGLTREEIRLLGAYSALSAKQQAALLVLTSSVVIDNARRGSDAAGKGRRQ